MCRLVTQPEVLRGLESLGIVYIVTEGTARGDYVNYPVGFQTTEKQGRGYLAT